MAYWNSRGGSAFSPKAGPSKSTWVDAPREGWTDHQLKPENRERLRNCREYDQVPFAMVGEAPRRDEDGKRARKAEIVATARKQGINGDLHRTGSENSRLSTGFRLMGAEDE